MNAPAACAALDFLLAPLQAALCDPAVTEILVNGPGAAWMERHGELEPLPQSPAPEALASIARLVANLSSVDTLDRDAVVEGRWQDWRVTMALPPVSGDHPSLALRRHRAAALPLDSWGAPAVAVLRQALLRRDNLLVAGATGSGKTTLVASLMAELDKCERLVCLEDTPELPALGPHQLRLHARQGHSLRSLLRLALRLRPDRIVVGEVRGGEAFDLLQAMATGHRGCLATLHAADARGALHRLEQLVLTVGLGWPLEAVRRQVADNVQVVAVAGRTPLGRTVTQVCRVDGLQAGTYRLVPLLHAEPDVAMTGDLPRSRADGHQAAIAATGDGCGGARGVACWTLEGTAMIHHLSLGVRDLVRAAAFYDALLRPLGWRRVFASASDIGYGSREGEDVLCLKLRDGAHPPGPGFHLAFAAAAPAVVDDCHRAALAAGGADNGLPGSRPHYGTDYYAGFLRDPDGYEIEVVSRGPCID